MEIILLERVEKLGNMGDVVSVRAGYARNYLLPQKKALRATKENLTHFESHKDELQAHNLKFRDEATAVAARMKGFSCVLVRQAGESDQLYGSVTARDIANELSAGGYNLERRQVILDSPIKTLGVFDVNIALHPEVVTQIKVNVARSEAEAESQAESRLQDAEGGTSAEFFENEELAESAAEELSEDLMDDDGLGLNDAPEDGAEA